MARIVTACNSQYLGRIMPYLDSLKVHSSLPVTLITVGFTAKLPGIDCIELPRSMNQGSPLETESPQHGSFLQVLDGPDDETIIFTDGDIIMQRPITADELAWIAEQPDNCVDAGYNSGPLETMTVEANRLFPRFSIEQIGARFGFMDRNCYNIGVFVTRRSTYKRIYAEYMKYWQLASEAFGGPARQQWLVIHTIHRIGVRIRLMQYTIHANGHYGMPAGCEYRNGLVYSGSEVVCFRHKL